MAHIFGVRLLQRCYIHGSRQCEGLNGMEKATVRPHAVLFYPNTNRNDAAGSRIGHTKSTKALSDSHAMKRLIFLAILLVMAVGLRAQQTQVATLLHNGEITVFYNADGLEKAYAASVDGDVITLSSGQFNAVNLNKNITVRGAGMGVKDADGTSSAPTILTGDFTVGAKDTAGNCLTLEGLQHNSKMKFASPLRGANFYKCYFNKVASANTDATARFQHLTFLHCNINSIDLSLYNSSRKLVLADFNFVNCVLMKFAYPYSTNNDTRSVNYIFTNCTIYIRNNGSISTVHHCMFTNSILYNNTTTSSSSAHLNLGETSMAYNCIYLTSNTNDTQKDNPFVNGSANGNNTFIPFFSESPFNEDSFYGLIDKLKAYKGTDGKEVGIHGGSLPFSPRTSNPQIVKFDVAPRTTRDGKLSVDIEVSSDQ